MSQVITEAAEAFRRAVFSAPLGELSFPTNFDVSRKILKAIENPEIDLSVLAKIVSAEPLLSAKMIRFANSVALNPGNQVVRDVRQAVLRVGMDLTKALTLVLMMDQLRQASTHRNVRKFTNLLWERSVHVAALTYVLARKLTKLSADEAMFAGIVHNLGRFYLLFRAAKYPVLFDDMEALSALINDLSERASEQLLKAVNLPASVLESVLAARHFSGHLPPTNLSDLLHVACVLSPQSDPFDELDPRRVTAEVDPRIYDFINQGKMADLLATSKNEIDSMVGALAL